MATAPRRERGRRAAPQSPRPLPAALQQHYATATWPLSRYFAPIDAWLLDHEPTLWHQLHAADAELLHLRRLGVSEQRFRVELDAFLARCADAERRYYEAQPSELRLPPLPAGARVGVYFELSDGSLRTARDED